MNNPSIQRIYSDIVARGYRNAPTYNEVKRDMRELSRRMDPLVGFRG
ncbi:MAG: hypothetical protein M0R73_11585 [Dehalococcoidia bacterium]|nr:hypothetical protein [Dehalococcoidia bacterium]